MIDKEEMVGEIADCVASYYRDELSAEETIDTICPETERVRKALVIASDGVYDGGHHKVWVIDQMVRALTGCPEVEKECVDERGKTYKAIFMEEGEDYLSWLEKTNDLDPFGIWDMGIAP